MNPSGTLLKLRVFLFIVFVITGIACFSSGGRGLKDAGAIGAGLISSFALFSFTLTFLINPKK
mgnify:CR=1 FL=1